MLMKHRSLLTRGVQPAMVSVANRDFAVSEK